MKKSIIRYWPIVVPVFIIAIATTMLITRCGNPKGKMVIGMADAEFINISSVIPGKMDSLLIREGDTVKESQLLAIISSTAVSNLQQQAKLNLDAANIQLDLLRKGTRPEVIGMAENLYQIAKQQYEVAKQTNSRIENLFANQVISGEEKDLVNLKYQAALHEMESAKMNLEMLRKGNQPELIKAAEIGVQQATQALSLSGTVHEDARIVAPANGIITSVVIHRGEFVSLGYPIITLMKNGTQFIRFNILQNHMKEISIGKIFNITMPGCEPETFPATVTHIEPSLTFADWVPVKESGTIELRTFTIEVKPTHPSSIRGFRPGMTASLTLP